MNLKVLLHEAEEGGYLAEVPAVSGCATQGDTLEELKQNVFEAIEACLSVDVDEASSLSGDRVLEITL